MDDDTHDSFTQAVARMLGERVGDGRLDCEMVSNLIEAHAEDCMIEPRRSRKDPDRGAARGAPGDGRSHGTLRRPRARGAVSDERAPRKS